MVGNSKKVLQYDLDGKFVDEFESVSDAKRKLDISDSNIIRCCCGKIKKTKGYMFRYFKDEYPLVLTDENDWVEIHTVVIPKERKCSKCNIVKSSDLFSRAKSNNDGLRTTCKECDTKINLTKRRTKKGLIHNIYQEQKNSCKTRDMEYPTYTRDELYDWFMIQENFDELYTNWVASGYETLERPSVDRLDDYVSYTMDNIQLMTWRENKRKGELDKFNGINNKSSTNVLQYDLEGNFIEEYPSINIACRKYNINGGNISSCCRGDRHVTVGFQWKYKKDNEEIIMKIDPFVKHTKNNSKVLRYSLEGELLNEYENLEVAGAETGFQRKTIGACCRGEKKSYQKSIWKYEGGYTKEVKQELKYCQFDLDDNFIKEYNSTVEIHNETGIDRSSILKACKGQRKTVGGFKWKYKHDC